ncbi:BUB protein kinase [Salpingoeca rosetta]|uniref:BUB protein kinase n=1 Tax=Salpingoeca rosetta (strain ATCC 50818 / BSB-021) TaxID=946362 RepID=F2UMD7_SALR5|nr:BUB protein kinase [Salpingoeca rosetta]EGD78286.1 BUB protein kinase [Salpingoeca rosetta]|eukprot:XP_004989609.1 BUB protein kinase [Salpingoeca rosetta]
MADHQQQQQQHIPQDWETCKENFKPRRQGYSAESVMNAAVATPFERLAEQERAFEEAVFTSGGSDPLDIWKRYIAWAEERENSADYQIDVARLLERCIKRFERDETVRNDERFLKICLKYADRCDEPFQIFTFLFDRRIGIQTPLFWLTWSVMYESIKNYDEAVEKLERGIITMTEPEPKTFLQRKLTALQQRASYHREKQEAASPVDSPAANADEDKRITFGELPQTRSGRLPVNRGKFARQGGRGLKNVVNGRPGLGLGARSSGNNGALSIYQDSAEDTQERRHRPVVLLSRPQIRSFPDASATAKENSRDPSGWHGTGGLRTRPTAAATAEPLDVYEDEDVKATTGDKSPAPKLPKASRKKVLQPKKPAAPVRIFHDYARERGLERELPGQYLMYDPRPLLEDPATEYCFEEMRASHWLAANHLTADHFPIEHDYDNDLDVSMGGDEYGQNLDTEDHQYSGDHSHKHMLPTRTPAAAMVNAQGANDTRQADAAFTAPEANRRERRALRALPNAGEESEPENTVTKRLHFSVLDHEEQEEQRDEAPSPTINTKAAMADVMAMFGGALNSPTTESGSAGVSAVSPRPSQPLSVFQDVNTSTGAHADDEAEDVDSENKENCAPLEAKKPKMSAAQEACQRTGQSRSVLGELKGFDLCSPEELAAARAYSGDDDDGDDEDDDQGNGRNHGDIHGFGSNKIGGNKHLSVFGGKGDDDDDDDGGDGENNDEYNHHRGAAKPNTQRRPLGERQMPSLLNDSHDADERHTSNGPGFAQQHHHHPHRATMLSPILEASHEISSSASFLSTRSSRTPSAAGSGPQSTLTTPSAECTTVTELARALASKCQDAIEASSMTVVQPTNVPALKPGQVLQKIVPDCTLSVWRQSDPRAYLAVEYAIEDYDSSDVEYLRCFQLKVVEHLYEARMSLLVLDRLKQLEDAQLRARAMASVSVPVAFHVFNNGLVMCSTYSSKASLADLVASNADKGVACDETLVMFYAIELLRTMEALHSCGFVAGNFQPENILLRCDLFALEAEEEQEATAPWNARGANGWKHYGVVLTNFARAADMQELPRQTFEDHQLLASLGRTAGAFERDYVDVADVLHQLLFGSALAVEQDADTSQFKLQQPIKPYWQRELWHNMFTTLLNNTTGSCDLSSLRRDFEGYLESNSYKSSSLHGLLIRQDLQLSD